MTGSELTMLLSHYPGCEVCAYDKESGNLEPVAAIAFDAASHAVELRTFRKKPKEG